MTVENNYAIAIAAFIDWLKILAPVFQLMHHVRAGARAIFPALSASYGKFLAICSDCSFCCLFLSELIRTVSSTSVNRINYSFR